MDGDVDTLILLFLDDKINIERTTLTMNSLCTLLLVTHKTKPDRLTAHGVREFRGARTMELAATSRAKITVKEKSI